MAIPRRLNKKKMENAILYFLEHINNEHLGKTKIMKLLYYLDFDHYEQYGNSVTGDIYLRYPLGPVPRHANTTLREMAPVDLTPSLKAVGPHIQERYEAQRGCDLNVFDCAEIKQLEKVATRWKCSTANAMVRASHSEAPYLVAEAEHGRYLDYKMAQFRTPVGKEPEDEIWRKSANFRRYIERVASRSNA